VTIGEIERGIEQQQRLNPEFAASLTAWLDVVLRTYEGRILPVDIAVARRWGRLSQQIGNRGLDLAIAATALEHGLTVVTRNVSDFERTGVSVLDPFDSRSRSKRESKVARLLASQRFAQTVHSAAKSATSSRSHHRELSSPR
jgi:hypothetical protein